MARFSQMPVGDARPARGREAEELIRRAVGRARERPDVRGLGLVGSRARGTGSVESDIDLVLLTHDTRSYLEDDGWIQGLAPAVPVAIRQWGRVTERRLALASGLEVDLGIADDSWAGTRPVDAGTRGVARSGMVILHDPHGLLAELLGALGLASSPMP